MPLFYSLPHILLLLYIHTFTIPHMATAFPLLPLSLPPLQNISGVPALGRDIDARFTIIPSSTHTPMNATACLMTAVNILSILATRDYYSNFRELRFSMPEYPQVAIEIEPSSGKSGVATRYAVWGVYMGTVALTGAERVEFAEVAMFWEGGMLGWVSFRQTGKGLSGGDAVSNQTSNILALSGNLQEANGPLALGTEEPTIFFQPAAQSSRFHQLDVFFAILAALKDLAPYPTAQCMTTAFSASAGIGYDARIRFPVRVPPLTGEICMRVGMMVEALRRLPGWMFEKGWWGEVDFGIMIGDVFVGSGELERGEGVADV